MRIQPSVGGSILSARRAAGPISSNPPTGAASRKKAPVLRPGLKFGDGPPKEGGPTAML